MSRFSTMPRATDARLWLAKLIAPEGVHVIDGRDYLPVDLPDWYDTGIDPLDLYDEARVIEIKWRPDNFSTPTNEPLTEQNHPGPYRRRES